MNNMIIRLKSRGDGKGSWAAKQIDRCIEGLSNPIFARHIDSNHMSIVEIVTEITSTLGITLLPDNRGFLRKVYGLLNPRGE